MNMYSKAIFRTYFDATERDIAFRPFSMIRAGCYYVIEQDGASDWQPAGFAQGRTGTGALYLGNGAPGFSWRWTGAA